jgi:hypothetical protein
VQTEHNPLVGRYSPRASTPCRQAQFEQTVATAGLAGDNATGENELASRAGQLTTKLTGARFSTYDAARTRIDERLRHYGPLGKSAKHAIGFVPSTTGGHLATYDVVIERPCESMGVIAVTHDLIAHTASVRTGVKDFLVRPSQYPSNAAVTTITAPVTMKPCHRLVSAHGLTPELAVVVVGDNPASATYVTSKKKMSAQSGISRSIIVRSSPARHH